MSVVYLAQQTNNARQVAVKIMPTHLLSDSTFVQRFEREVALTGSHIGGYNLGSSGVRS
jgi:serine/threonine protein kinase